MAGVAGAAAVVAALLYRSRTGKGQYIDSAQMEVGASLLGPYYLDYIVNGRDPAPVGNAHPGAAPHGPYPCAGEEQWCVISVETQEQWCQFCKAAGHPEWEHDERFATPLARERHRGDLDDAVASWTRTATGPEIADRLQAVGVAAAPVQDVEDQLLRDPQYRDRAFFVELEEPEMGTVITEYPPARLSETPAQVRTPAPLMGEHTDQIMRDLLHLSEGEIEELKTAGVLD
jgi:benzylsuccinate CoA-transferase BbsF subunit